MKTSINKDTIKALNPCSDTLENYLKHYSGLSMDILEFLALNKITAKDKIWVAIRLMPRELVEVFAVDCAIKAINSANTAAVYAATNAANAAYDAANAAAYDATNAAVYAATNAAYDAANAAVYAAYDAANAAVYAATNAAVDAAYDSSLEDSVDALAYLIKESR